MSTETTYEPTRAQIDILHHALGMERCNYMAPREWWVDNDNHRNFFATAESFNNYSDCVALESAGLMIVVRRFPGELIYYRVTEAGIDLARQRKPTW